MRATGIESVRFHGLLDDEMGPVVARGVAGGYVYNFTLVDSVFDFMTSLGVAPYIELSFMPTALASGTTTYMHYRANVTPPKNMTQWHELVQALAAHLVSRYGIAEVARWNFECWNEPNLAQPLVGGFWTGTQQQYFDLYRSTALALKAVSPRLQVGGPATSAGGWLAPFLQFVLATATPIDFVSLHSYPTDISRG